MYGHVAKLAEAEKKGVEAAGGQADIYQFVLSWKAQAITQMLTISQDRRDSPRGSLGQDVRSPQGQLPHR